MHPLNQFKYVLMINDSFPVEIPLVFKFRVKEFIFFMSSPIYLYNFFNTLQTMQLFQKCTYNLTNLVYKQYYLYLLCHLLAVHLFFLDAYSTEIVFQPCERHFNGCISKPQTPIMLKNYNYITSNVSDRELKH